MSIGKLVKAFSPGEKVVTHMLPNFSEDGFPTMTEIGAGLGHSIDGTIREFGVFQESVFRRSGNTHMLGTDGLECIVRRRENIRKE